ncbi:helix-turn-helix domain-containing protein [Nocardioides sp.]|uniref:helix-turn-helix domain-containing protein n=1 Tax=Nocardioides sp. TaxID=35761 RepID=UPI0039E29830
MTAAAAIEDILERSGLTKSELSTRSGVSRSLIDDYLKGRRQPSVAQLERLGEAAGLRLDIIWGPKVEPDIKPTPRWAIPSEEMKPPPLSERDRAEVLVRVVEVAMCQRRRLRGELEFPPFRKLLRQ